MSAATVDTLESAKQISAKKNESSTIITYNSHVKKWTEYVSTNNIDENDLNETLPDQIMMCIHQYVGESNLGISSADGLRSALVNHYDSKGLAYQGLFTVHQGVYSGNPAQSKIVSCFILNQFNIL